MLSGSVILLSVEVFGAKTHYLKQVDQEILDFSMERASFDKGAVRGQKEGSRVGSSRGKRRRRKYYHIGHEALRK
jgi:hypothetical protein